VIYLRNTHPTRHASVPIGQNWIRLLMPQNTVAVPSAALALPHVQQLLADQRLAVVTECTGSADARAAAASRRDMQAAIAQAERQAFDRLIARQQQQHQLSAEAVLGGQRPRTKADDEWLRAAWLAGTSRTAIARRLGITPQGAGLRAKALRLPPRCFRKSRARVPARL
jgi:hypothetical protein